MNNEKGFTTVELIVSFTLLMMIMAFLFEMIFSLKELYTSTGIKTDLLTKQTVMSRKINSELYNKKLTNITNCGNECLIIFFDDGSSSELSIDRVNRIFRYGSYTTKLVETSDFGTATVTSETFYEVADNKNNTIIQIKIPIIDPLYEDEDFGINVIYQYDNRLMTIADFSFES